MEIMLINTLPLSKSLTLITYQIVTKLNRNLHLFDYHMYLRHSHTSTAAYDYTHFKKFNLVFLYTIWTTHGFGINIWLRAIDMKNPTNVSVSVYDRPFLIESFDFRDLTDDGFWYQAGFRATISVIINDDIKQKVSLFSFKTYEHKQHVIFLEDNSSDIQKISLNTSERPHNPIFYYKYLTVRAKTSKYIQMTFTKLRKYTGESYHCAEGGFVLSDNNDTHLQVTGPFCTQHGTEPLVNDIKTFQSTHDVLTFFLYSYSFEMDVDIEF